MCGARGTLGERKENMPKLHGETEGERQLGTSSRRWERNVKMDLLNT